MSYPVINRWGLNLFWIKFWYSDKVNFSYNHQGPSFESLILIYLNYGLNFFKNPIQSKYWQTQAEMAAFSSAANTGKYFRQVEYVNKALNDYSKYRSRLGLKNIYFSKIWIVFSQKWIIFNLYIFSPVKKQRIIKKKKHSLASVKVKTKAIRTDYYRFKLLILHAFTQASVKTFYYNF